MRNTIAIAILLVCILFNVPSYAANESDKFVACDEDGNDKGAVFTRASISVAETAADLDSSGNYTYYGMDIGILKKPANYDASNPLEAEWDTVFIERVVTNELEIEIEDFGDLSKYSYDDLYVIGTRVLYKPIGSPSNPIAETEWKMEEDDKGDKAYFKVVPPDTLSGDKLVTCDIDGTSTGTIFSKASIPISEIDTSGIYAYYGVDVGVFKKPASYDPSNPLDAEWDTVFIERVVTNELEIEIEDFGDLSKYSYDDVYLIGTRVLYKPIGSPSNPIVETEWKMNEDDKGDKAYFKLIPPEPVLKSFTDRVTGANNWMTDVDAVKYNWYKPGSEVVSRLTINPQSENFEGYEIKLDANTDNNKIKIQNMEVVKIQIEGDGTTYPIPAITQVNPHAINMKLDIPVAKRNKEVMVYFKYKFNKLNPNDNLKDLNKDTFINKVTVIAQKGAITNTIEKANTIKIVEIKIIYN